MSDAEAEGETEDEVFDPERLADLVGQIGEYVTEIKRAIVDDEDGGDIVELAEDLWEVLEELEELLETLDFEELPEAIDVEDIPEAVDVEDIPEGLFDEDESAIDLGDVTEAVNLRELWDAVDLTQFLQEKREFEAAVDDVTDDEDGDGDGEEDDGMFENVVDMDGADASFEQSARQQFIEEKILAAVEKFRSALLSTHDGLRKIYRENQKKLGQEGNQPDSLNPTARSTMPPGPLPDSISTRTSTVPSQVKYSRADNPRRIFGRRFKERHDDEDSRTTSADADAEESTDADSEGADTDGATADAESESESESESDDDAPEIEVFEENE
ncbi:hypothetical protein HWV07_16645 [Natronomonas salina]|uniref:hypothetical protein n=1 Tax=Natronomonas salina TaxID=1710540 RepID=UPI0015B4D4AF|nr:hypothetical protein [Natronomonas salina]QLD90575.1 hypothetical protein HWV07_16645 [Natronomonas salina]